MKSALLAAIAIAGPAAATADEQRDVVVITADRRAVSVDQTPGNAAALDAAQLHSIGAQHPAEALNQFPGVSFDRGSGVETLPAIRSPVLTAGDGAGSILVLEDAVPIRAPGFANINEEFETSLDFADRVEVTRGPGSALYGSNAVHGIIDVLTPNAAHKADQGERGEGHAEAGQFGRVEGDYLGFLRAPDAAPGSPAWLLGLAEHHETGWRADASVNEQRALLGRDGAIGGGWQMQARAVFMNMNQNTAGFVIGADAYKDSRLSRQNADPEAFRDEQLARFQSALSHRLGAGEFKIIPFARWIDTHLLEHFLPSKALENSTQKGGGFEASYYYDPSPRLSWIFGLDVDRSRGSELEVQTIPDQPNGYLQGVHYDYAVDALALGAYAQARWQFAPRWTAVAGLRGENVRYDYDNHLPAGDFGRFRRPVDRADTFTATTPKFGVVRAFGKGGSLYFNYARGARPPQTSDLYSLQVLQNPGDQKDETIESEEIGLRKPIGAGRIDVAAYHMMKRHAAFRNANGFTVPNARTEHNGIEISGYYSVLSTLSVSGWWTYAQHTYRFSDPSTLSGETITFGADVDTAPHWIWNAAITWAPLTRAHATLGWTHMGRYFTNAANTHVYPGHNVFDLRLEWDAQAQTALYATIRNLTNTDYAERADFAFGQDRYFPGEDRALSLGVRQVFN